MPSFVSARRAAIVATAVACVGFLGVAPVSAAQPSTTVNGLRYELVSAKRAPSVGGADETVRARGTFVVLRLRVSNGTDKDERAFLLQATLTGRSGVRYRVATDATNALSADHFSENTLQEVHPHFPIPVVIAFDVPAQERDFTLHIVAHYPVIGTGGTMRLNL